MDRVNTIARGSQRNVRKISEMAVNHPYAIEGVRKTTTQYGEKIIVDLQNNEYSFLPVRLQKEFLANGEAGLIEFQQQLQVTPTSIRRLPGRLGRSWPIEFITTPQNDVAAGNLPAGNLPADLENLFNEAIQ